MALPWALAVLSLLPLLNAKNPACANLTAATPITNATLNRISGKWFYIASAFRNPMFQESAQKIQADFFYFYPNLTDDTVLLQEYQTTEDQCIFNSSLLRVQRENGTLSKFDGDKEYIAHLLFLRDPRTYMLAFLLEDEKNKGLSFYADKPEATPEQLEEFHEAIACIGMLKSEIIYTDWKKNLCGPLHHQHKLKLEKKEAQP